MKKRMQFLKTAISDMRVGAVTRSSKYVVTSVLKNLGQRKLREVVEYGPGDGIMTKELLRRLSPDGRLLAIELNEGFVDILREIGDLRLEIVRGRVQDVVSNLTKYNFSKVDAVVSSIPFSMLSKNERDTIIRNTFDYLAPGGRFIIFHQYSQLMREPLEAYFDKVNVTFEPRNILPCFILCAQKLS